jgi:rfaE bifunctional protein kinase chain/domain
LQRLAKIISNFSNVKVLVVGDVMLDHYLWGSVSRISPEAPVPIVNINKSSLVLGGAANVAANIAGLGGAPLLIGITGEDKEAEILSGELERANISSSYLVPLKDRLTTIKTRIVAHSQHVVRFDQETVKPILEDEENLIYKKVEEVLEKVSIIIISDYAKGLLTEKLLERLIRFARSKNKIVLVDPKGKDFSKYKGAAIITPNRSEAMEACNLQEQPDVIDKAGKKLLTDLHLKAVLITQGERGMTILDDKNKVCHLKALARKVYDVTGAGDTVIASFAVALGAGADYFEAAKIANISAGLVVEQIGTTAISQDMLQSEIKNQDLEFLCS